MTQRTQQTPVRRLWTEAEDQALIEEIGRNPLNLRMCFIAASIQIRRTPSACASRWYSALSKSTKKRHVAILTMGRNVAVRNKKRFKEGMEMIDLPTGFFIDIVNRLFRRIGSVQTDE